MWKTFDNVSVEEMDMAMKTNIYGLLTCCKEVAPGMVERGNGFICITGATAQLPAWKSSTGVEQPPVVTGRSAACRSRRASRRRVAARVDISSTGVE